MLLPELAETLGRQRGKYYGFGNHTAEYPVFEQAPGKNIDLAPVNNLEMERRLGDMDNTLKRKSNNLNAASRSMILKKVFSYIPDVRGLPNFHEMGAVTRRIEQIIMECSDHQKALLHKSLPYDQYLSLS